MFLNLGTGGETIRKTVKVIVIAATFMLLAVCFSGMSAKACDDSREFGPDEQNRWREWAESRGLGTWDDPSSWNPGYGHYGLGTWDDPSQAENPGTGE